MYTILIEVPPCKNSEHHSDIDGHRNLKKCRKNYMRKIRTPAAKD